MKQCISVILPVYNGEARIEKCLESLFLQSFKNVELIIIDDGSKDNSFKVIEKEIEKNKDTDVKVLFIRQDNMGVAKTRNYGISIAKGEYITFVDQDDYLDVDYLKVYHEKAISTETDIVVGGYQRITDEKKVIRKVKLNQSEWSRYIVVSPWAHLYKKSFLIEEKIEFLKTGLGEDVYFNLVAYSRTDKIAITEDTGYFWVYNPVSVSNKDQKKVSKKADPMLLLNAIHRDVNQEKSLSHNVKEYFLIRYIVWYLLYTVRSSNKTMILESKRELFEWLKLNYPNFNKNPFISLFRPKGESLSIRGFVFVTMTLYRLNLLNLMLKIFSIKDE